METIGRLAGGIATTSTTLLAVILMRLEMALALVEANLPIRRHLESLRAGRRSAELTGVVAGFARRQPVTPRAGPQRVGGGHARHAAPAHRRGDSPDVAAGTGTVARQAGSRPTQPDLATYASMRATPLKAPARF